MIITLAITFKVITSHTTAMQGVLCNAKFIVFCCLPRYDDRRYVKLMLMSKNRTHATISTLERNFGKNDQNENNAKNRFFDALFSLLSPAEGPLFIKPQLLDKASAWFGHVPFAHWLVSNIKPRTIVELGSHNGISYSAFCSSVLREGLTTRCYAVDTWEGDEQAGFYGEEIYQKLKVFHDSNYKAFSTLIRASFDEAVQFFDDGTIDILHIDGLYTYEAVSHDFKTWKGKVSPQGVVIFHDTNEYKKGFGVWKFWQEMKKQYPFFECIHNHGLGIVAIGDTPPLIVKELCSLPEDLKVLIASKFQKIGTIWAELASTTREKYALTKELTELNIKLKEEDKTKSSLSDRVNKLEKDLQAKDQQIESLSNALTNEQDLLKDTIEKKNDQIKSLDQRNRLQEESLKRLKEDIQNLKAQSEDAQVLQDEISRLKIACEENVSLLNESEERRKVLERTRIETAKSHKHLKNEQIKLSSALSQAKADKIVLNESLKRERLSAQNAVAKIRSLEEKKGSLRVQNLTAAKVKNFLTSEINLIHKKLSRTREINNLRLQKLAKQYRDLSTNKLEIHDLNHKISELRNCQNLLNLQNFQLNQALSELQSENIKLKVDNSTLSENLSSITKQLGNVLGATHKYQADLSRIINSKKWQFLVSITALLTTPKRIASVFRLSEINRRKTYKQVYKVIQESNLFDPEWYLDNYEDLVGKVLDPLDHYIKYGSHEGRNPSLYFDTSLYLQLYPDVNPLAYEPLLHYITHGKKEGRIATYLQFVYDKISSSGLFDVEWYKRTYLLDTLTGSNSSDATNDPITHYIQIGANLGYNPSPTFDSNFYKNSYPDVAQDKGNPLLHYILFGQSEGRITTLVAYNYHLIKNSPLFDGEYYKNTYQLDNNVDLISHYFEEGVKLSYNPSPYFETSFYLNRYPEVANNNINPLLHYINSGQKEGRLATEYENARRIVKNSSLFDDIWYQKVYKIDEDPVDHYLREGPAEGFNPSQFFDTFFYLSKYPDIGGTNPLVHFETSGRSEGRLKTEREYHYEQIKGSDYFDSEWYQNEYLEVLHGIDPIYHYLDLGGREGLNPCPDFDTEFYLEHYPDAKEAPSPLLHYLESGKENFTNFKQVVYQTIKNSEYFDIDWYSEKYKVGEDPVLHYIETGVSEGNNPSLDFDTKFYLDQYQDVAAYGLNPLYHYIVAGKAEGRYRTFDDYQYHIIKTSELFDQEWYQNQYHIYDDPARHYLEIGVFSCADPSPQFSTSGYLHRYPDVAASELNPLFHYIQYGKEELRDCTPHPSCNSRSDLNFNEQKKNAFLKSIQKNRTILAKSQPLISIILPTRDRELLVVKAIKSVIDQTYQNWELMLIDDGSQDNTVKTVEATFQDSRIKILQSHGNGVCEARNIGLQASKGKYIGYLDSDNTWTPEYLETMMLNFIQSGAKTAYAVLQCINCYPVKFRQETFEFNKLITRNFIDLNVFMHQRDLLEDAGTFDTNLKRMVDWDLIIRLTKDNHPSFAYFIGALYDSGPSVDRITNRESLSYLDVVRNKHWVDWKALKSSAESRDSELVSIVICVFNQEHLTDKCLESIFKHQVGAPFEIILVDNASYSPTKEVLAKWEKNHENIKVVTNPENFNFALGNNIGFSHSKGKRVIFLNNDTEVTPEWASNLTDPLTDPKIKGTQPKLIFPDGSIQCVGVVFSEFSCFGYPIYSGASHDFYPTLKNRNFPAITAACMAIRAEDFIEAQGFDPIYTNGQEDIDLCLRLGHGENVFQYVADTVIIHHESKSSGRSKNIQQNRKIFLERWLKIKPSIDSHFYKEDSIEISGYFPDSMNWENMNLAALKPRLKILQNSPELKELQALLSDRTIAIKIGCPRIAERQNWGDYHFAVALNQCFIKRGLKSRIDFLPDWYKYSKAGDINLVLRGLSNFKPSEEWLNLIWLISHPDKTSEQELKKYDAVFVASEKYCEHLINQGLCQSSTLLQCTDPSRFYRRDRSELPKHELLFVGNSRRVMRTIAKEAQLANIPIDIFGKDWENLVTKEWVKGATIKNSNLPDYYAGAEVVLNDHWDDMKEKGFVSNRIFDALACGTPVVTDEVPGIPEDLRSACHLFHDAESLKQAIQSARNMRNNAPDELKQIAETTRRLHSFDNRVERILKAVVNLISK